MSLIVMPFGLIAMLLMPFGLDAPFLKVMGHGMALVIEVADEVASWGGSAATGRPHGWFIGIASAGFLLLTLLRSRLALLGIPPLLLAFGLSAATSQRDLPDLLVHEDGSLVALLDENKVYATKPGRMASSMTSGKGRCCFRRNRSRPLSSDKTFQPRPASHSPGNQSSRGTK